MSGPTRIFISYRREDTRHVAGRLGDRLMAEKFTVFMDIETIVPGMDFTAAVLKAVNESDVLLALIGTSWTTLADPQGNRRLDNPGDWVVQEIARALQRGIVVIPLLIDGVRMPSAAELPPSIAALASRQALALRHESFAVDASRLVEVIRQMSVAAETTARQTALQGWYDRALSAARDERWDDAMSALGEVVAIDPTYRGAGDRLNQIRTSRLVGQLTGDMRALYGAGQWASVLAVSEELARVNPDFADPEGMATRAREFLMRSPQGPAGNGWVVPTPPPSGLSRGSKTPVLIALGAVLLAAVVVAIALIPWPKPSTTGGDRTSATPSPTSTALPSPSPSPSSENAAHEALRRQVPNAFSDTCEPYEPTDKIIRAAMTVALWCKPGTGGPADVIYYKYDSTTSAQKAYRGIVGSNLASVDCTKDPGEMTYTATTDGVERPGKLTCLKDNPKGTQAFVWVDNQLQVVANSWDANMTFATMKKWWENAGPLKVN